ITGSSTARRCARCWSARSTRWCGLARGCFCRIVTGRTPTLSRALRACRVSSVERAIRYRERRDNMQQDIRAPIPEQIHYLAIFRRAFVAIEAFGDHEDVLGMLMAGHLADALHN